MKYWKVLLYINLSNTLGNMGRTDSGLQFPTSLMLLTLKIDEAFVLFRCTWKMSSLNELWKIINNGQLTSPLTLIMTLLSKSCYPTALLGFSDLNIFSNSSKVCSLYFSTGHNKSSNVLVVVCILPDRFGSTFAKYLI